MAVTWGIVREPALPSDRTAARALLEPYRLLVDPTVEGRGLVELCVPFGDEIYRFHRTRWDRPSLAKALATAKADATRGAIAALTMPDIDRNLIDRLFDGYEIIFPGGIPPEARRCEGKRVIDAKSFIEGLTVNIGDMGRGDEDQAQAFATKILDVAKVANAHKLALRFNY
jgi:hypothetical protein